MKMSPKLFNQKEVYRWEELPEVVVVEERYPNNKLGSLQLLVI